MSTVSGAVDDGVVSTTTESRVGLTSDAALLVVRDHPETPHRGLLPPPIFQAGGRCPRSRKGGAEQGVRAPAGSASRRWQVVGRSWVAGRGRSGRSWQVVAGRGHPPTCGGRSAGRGHPPTCGDASPPSRGHPPGQAWGRSWTPTDLRRCLPSPPSRGHPPTSSLVCVVCSRSRRAAGRCRRW